MKAFFGVCTFLVLILHLTQGCPWMQHKFPQYSRNYLTLLEEMGEKITEDNVGLNFPDELYRLARKSQPERIIWFIAQVLDEVSLLLDENVTAVAWDQKKLKDFMSTLDTQLVATQSCVSKTKGNKRLHLYFKKLRNETLGKMEDKAKAWELIRKEVHRHLTKVDLLASTRL
ncbi:interferon a3-like isoform X1 [Alosa sapidissima]|uniref:interferon a3-like isoform X1 n=1 Tax=Alosa sapidissima TaxID=34773 RepID=UPI001C083064|nr:interferon a3-like isoform X1 [Alosa sapidissima]